MIQKVYDGLPFELIEQEEFMQVRKFDPKIQDEELKWHRDREDRLIRKIDGSGWLLQLDNEMPIDMDTKQSHFIPAGVWHRIIKTSRATDLVLQIHLRCNTGEARL